MPEFLFSSLDCYRSLRSFFYFAVLAAHFVPCAMLARSSTVILRFSRRILRLAAMLARSSTVVHSLRCASCKTQTASTITRKICASFAFYASLRLAGNVGRSTVWRRLMPPAPRFAGLGMWGTVRLWRLVPPRDSLRLAGNVWEHILVAV